MFKDISFIHFGLTSQDINNTAISISLKNYIKSKFQSSFNKIIADKMIKGLSKESAQLAEIGQVLVAEGLSRTERIYLLSHDEDFIPDVLSCYKG